MPQKKVMNIIREKMASICLSDNVDIRTYMHYVKYGQTKGRGIEEDLSIIKHTLNKQKSLCDVLGPYIFYMPDPSKKVREAVKISNLVLNQEQKLRKSAIEYLLQEKMTDHMCSRTITKIKENKAAIFSQTKEKWISAAIELSDTIENDWLFNFQGVLQAVKMNFDAGIDNYLTMIMRPDISALESIGRGVLAPSQNQDEVKSLIQKIVAEASGFSVALEEYYLSFGHIPLATGISVCFLYDEWAKVRGPIGNVWQLFWEWANLHTSPLPRYHACCFFANNPKLVPTDDKKKFVAELIAVIYLSEQENERWYEPWLIRCELARYYFEYLECRLPSASSEKISTQSWWLADKVADVFGDNPANIKNFRKTTVEPEEFNISIVWQLVHLATEASPLRYATLYMKNMWSLSLVSQLCPETLELLLSVATETQKKAISAAVAGNLVNMFPIRRADEKLVFGFDNGCVETARTLVKLGVEDEIKKMLSTFIDGTVEVASEAGLKEYLKRLPEGNVADQLLAGHAVHILANMNKAPSGFIWDRLFDRDWVKSVFASLNPKISEHFYEGLIEIQLRTKGKWNEQLPHIYAMFCEELGQDKEKQKLLFAFTIISSMAADSVSAIDRLLKSKNRFDYQENVIHWRKKIELTFQLVPEWCRARLRAVLASLHI